VQEANTADYLDDSEHAEKASFEHLSPQVEMGENQPTTLQLDDTTSVHSESEDITEELKILNSKVDSPETPPSKEELRKMQRKLKKKMKREAKKLSRFYTVNESNDKKENGSGSLLKRVGSYFWGSKQNSTQIVEERPKSMVKEEQQEPIVTNQHVEKDTLELENCTVNLFSESSPGDATWRFVAFVEKIMDDRMDTFTKEIPNTGSEEDYATIIYGHPMSLKQSTGAKWKRSDMNVGKLNFGPADEHEKLRLLLSMMRKMPHLQQSIYVNGVRVHPQKVPLQ